MNKDDIIRMAREAGLPHWYEDNTLVNESRVLKFAALVADAEREECAKVCEPFIGVDCVIPAERIQSAIRARGEQK